MDERNVSGLSVAQVAAENGAFLRSLRTTRPDGTGSILSLIVTLSREEGIVSPMHEEGVRLGVGIFTGQISNLIVSTT